MTEISTRNLRSVYDRRRLLQDEVDPPVIDSLKDFTWEHQAEALKRGYQSVLHYALDLAIQSLRDHERRIKALEDELANAKQAFADGFDAGC